MKTIYYCETNPTTCRPKTFNSKPANTPECCGKPMKMHDCSSAPCTDCNNNIIRPCGCDDNS